MNGAKIRFFLVVCFSTGLTHVPVSLAKVLYVNFVIASKMEEKIAKGGLGFQSPK